MDKENFQYKGDARKPSLWLFVAAISGLMAAMSMGCVAGWSAPAFKDMKKIGLLKMTNVEDEQVESWMGSCITLGALVGGLLCGFAIQLLGRKKTLIALGIPYTVGWILICITKHRWLIIIGRVLTGFASGMSCGAAPTYVIELSTPNIRGLLGSGFQVFVNLGILYMDIFGLGLGWNYICIAGLVPGVLLTVLMIFMPESPNWLMMKYGRSSQVVDALTKLRQSDSNIESELKELEGRAEEAKQDSGFSREQLKRADVYKPFIIAIALMFFQQFSGINAVLFYSNDIFEDSGSSLDPSYATITVSASMVLATIFGSLVIDKLGRKMLLLISGIGHVLSLGVMGYYYITRKSGSKASTAVITTTVATTATQLTTNTTIAELPKSGSELGWLPVVCLVVFVIAFSIGYGPIPWMIVAEITPSSALSFISSIATAVNWTFAFAITKEIADVQKAITPYGAFWMFAGCSAASVVFVFMFVPETKGKSVEEMQKIFLGTKHSEYSNNRHNTNKQVSTI